MNTEIVESFAQMVRDKGIDKDVLAGILEEIFGLLVKKKYSEEAKFDVVVNMDRGDIEIFLEREIVDEVIDPNLQVSLQEVNRKGNQEELEVGDDFVDLGRAGILRGQQLHEDFTGALDGDLFLADARQQVTERGGVDRELID